MQVTLPEMGESVTEGTIAKWVKQPGDQVREGEGLVEVTTDKVDAEVPAPASGTLTKILAEAGKTVAVGAALAEIAVGADGDGAPKNAPTVSSAPNGEEKKAPALAASAGAAEEKSTAQVEVTEGAELLAKAKGVDLTTIKGSGPGGSIRRRDVAEAVERQQAAPTLPSPASAGGEIAPAKEEQKKAPTPSSPERGGGEIPAIPLRGAAAALVKYMEESLQVPTATSFRTVRVDVLDQRRRQLTQSIQAAGRPEKVSYTHLIAFAITRAVKDVPSMAVTFDRVDGNPARVARGAQLGLAVDVQRQDGSRMLLVPVIRDADRLDFAAFRDQYETLVSKARTGKLVADELSGAGTRGRGSRRTGGRRAYHGGGRVAASGCGGNGAGRRLPEPWTPRRSARPPGERAARRSLARSGEPRPDAADDGGGTGRRAASARPGRKPGRGSYAPARDLRFHDRP